MSLFRRLRRVGRALAGYSTSNLKAERTIRRGSDFANDCWSKKQLADAKSRSAFFDSFCRGGTQLAFLCGACGRMTQATKAARHEIHPGPIVSVYAELRYGPEENVCQNPSKESARLVKDSDDRRRARQRSVHRQDQSDRSAESRQIAAGASPLSHPHEHGLCSSRKRPPDGRGATRIPSAHRGDHRGRQRVYGRRACTICSVMPPTMTKAR